MRLGKSLATWLLFASLAGCGGVANNPVSVTPPASVDNIKASLKDIIATGQVGSGGGAIDMAIEDLRATDAAKADALKKLYGEMSSSADPTTVKAKAQEMMSKL